MVFGKLSEALVLESLQLAPATWFKSSPPRNLRVYNPAIIRYQGRLLMVYRLDSGRRRTARRRMAICELDERLNVIFGSVRPLSDSIQGAGERHYDPRFLVFRNRLFIHFNNNYQTRPNRIYLVELDPDNLEAKAPARPLQLDGQRREIEKNWMLFSHDGELYAVYRIDPHIILRLNLAGRREVACREIYRRAWDVSAYADAFGTPRGGTPPARHGRLYLSFFHSSRPAGRLHRFLRHWPIAPNRRLPRYMAALERRLRRPLAQHNYFAGFYAFEAAPPFHPVKIGAEPLLRPENEGPRKLRPRVNPLAAGVVYPCGAVLQKDGSWLLSYGRHDEFCCLRRLGPELD